MSIRALLKKCRDYNLNNAAKIQNEENIDTVHKRILEDSLAKEDKLQAHNETDINAVFSVCLDGDMTSYNQILFYEN